MRKATRQPRSNQERGIALIFVLFTLLFLSAIAVSLIFMTNTETVVNGNYRLERVSAFSAKAGMEEVRDRMAAFTANGQLPVSFPPQAGSVLYVLNEGAAAGTVQPWVAGNTYMDDELCHDFAGVQAQQPAPDVRCTTPPTAAMLVQTVTSNYPWSGTSAALPYKWVRVTLKQSNSVQNYPVNSASPTTQVCWNGSTEVLLNGAATCQAMTPSTNPVYMVTSLAASSTGTTRRMVQAEVALAPAQPFPYGIYATGTTCPAVTFSGGGGSPPATDSYTSANGGTYAGTASPTAGDVGSAGGFSISGNSQIGGAIGVPSLAAAPPNPCPGGDYTSSGNAGPYNPGAYPGNVVMAAGPFTFPTPADPVPLPTAASPVPGNACSPPVSKTVCAVPGTYGNINLSGQNKLVLAPGVYNIYSLSLSGQASVSVNPPGAVVLNFPSASQSPISISGQGIASATNIPNDMQINYGGTGNVTLSGNGASYAIVDAPNSSMTVSGNGDFFGRVVGKTITYSGNGKFHFDKNSALGPKSNGGYQLISFREISY
jgi:hypothetical protein